MVLEELVSACQAAVAMNHPMVAVKEVVQRAVTDRSLLDEVPGDGPGIFTVHRAPDLSIFKIVVPPGYTSLPHDHRMWAVVGICSGREDNEFFRKGGDTLEESGGRTLEDGDVLALGPETIHAVANPLGHAQTVAIHAYGGDLVSANRSMWVPDPWTEAPYDARRVTGTTFS
jgi:predicted metal-dependent enzyme (double-stranded beta helix superfamily)